MQQFLTPLCNITDSFDNDTYPVDTTSPSPTGGVVWVPYLAVLLFVLTSAILILSIYRYWKRVRKRQRAILDYLEVDIDLKRRRICGIMRTPIKIRFDEIHCSSIPFDNRESNTDTIKKLNIDYFSKQPVPGSPTRFTHSRKHSTSVGDDQRRHFGIWNVEDASNEYNGLDSKTKPVFDCDDPVTNIEMYAAHNTNHRFSFRKGGCHSEPGLFPLFPDLDFHNERHPFYAAHSKIFYRNIRGEMSNHGILENCPFDRGQSKHTDSIEGIPEKLLKPFTPMERNSNISINTQLLKNRVRRSRFFSSHSLNEPKAEGENNENILDIKTEHLARKIRRDCSNDRLSSKIVNVTKRDDKLISLVDSSKFIANAKLTSNSIGEDFKTGVHERSFPFASTNMESTRAHKPTAKHFAQNRCLEIETIHGRESTYKLAPHRWKRTTGGDAETDLFLCRHSGLGSGGSNPGSDTTDSSMVLESTDV